MTEQERAPEAEADTPITQEKKTSLGAYLLVARYNRDKWVHLAKLDQDTAHHTAEDVFPEDDRHYLPQMLTRTAPGQDLLQGVQMLHTFHSDIFATLMERIAENDTAPEQRKKKEVTDITDEVFAIRGAPARTHEKDPGIGWFAVVEANSFASFVERLGGREGPLWRMYDMEVIPLNDDKTTQDIYDFMTPVSWRK